MLEHFEGTNCIVGAGMRQKVLAQWLRDDVGTVGVVGKIRIETDIDSVWDDAPETSKSASDVKDTIPGPYSTSGEFEGVTDSMVRPKLALEEELVELLIKDVISLKRRIKKIQTRRRFPQTDPI